MSEFSPDKMTFFKCFIPDILSGKKTITIRDDSEKGYIPGSVVEVSTFEEDQWFCQLKIISVEPILFQDLTPFHAQQENMTLEKLRTVISEIYPGTEQLYTITYQLVESNRVIK